MKFNLNEFLLATSYALDFVEIELLGRTSNHSKRVAYISMKIAQEMKMSPEEIYDCIALAILHDNGGAERNLNRKLKLEKNITITDLESSKDHCIFGEFNVESYPFLTDVKNVIKYHHENYDGSGFFGLKGEEIPIISQIIYVADLTETNFDLINLSSSQEKQIMEYVKDKKNIFFSPKVVDAFLTVLNNKSFLMDLRNEFINNVLVNNIKPHYVNIDYEELHKITKVLSKIIDSKSKFTQIHSEQLALKTSMMADFYRKPHDEKMKLIIAADLHDIGKLAIPNAILDKPGKLTEEEFNRIKEHSYYTRFTLREISGFDEITEWASNHHEKLDGTGYPYGKNADELDFNSRLLACLDIYQALTEERPYRNPLNHEEAMKILNSMGNNGFIDKEIIQDIHRVFQYI